MLPKLSVAISAVMFTSALACSGGGSPGGAAGAAGAGAGGAGTSGAVFGGTASSGKAGSETSAAGTSSGGVAGALGDGSVFVPDGLPNTPRDGDPGGGLTVVAFTLIQGSDGPELYTAARNDGDSPACEAGITTDFFDKSGQQVASAGSALQGGRFYRLDGGGVIRCIDPGQIAMSASTDLRADIVISELDHLSHAFPAFMMDGITAVEGLTVEGVKPAATLSGGTFTGNLVNGFDVSVSAPKVTIFPLNRAGRPLGVATSSGSDDVPAGGSWSFETSSVSLLGVDYAAYPSASIPN
jgi:hypothetical protein